MWDKIKDFLWPNGGVGGVAGTPNNKLNKRLLEFLKKLFKRGGK